MSKKIIALILLFGIMTFLLCACAKSTTNQWAVISMPDGSSVEGFCDEWHRDVDGLIDITIDGLTFHASQLRVVIFDVEN